MAYILNFETSTKNCSVSIAFRGKNLFVKELNDGAYSHVEKLHLFIEQVLRESSIGFDKIAAVAVGKGPGSYTGLRVGVSAAKGFCFALNIPLISVDSLCILARSIEIDFGQVIVPMLDARRMEVYTATFDANYKPLNATTAQILDKHSFAEGLNNQSHYFLGDGASKLEGIISHSHAHFIKDKFPSAKQMAAISYDYFLRKRFEDLAYFEPFYLKDFVMG